MAGHANRLVLERAALIIVSIMLASTIAKSAGHQLVPVDVRIVGDDGLTLGLRSAVENAFKSSTDFTFNGGKSHRGLIVTIPTNVEWKKVGNWARVLYRVEFQSTDDQHLGKGQGACWDDALQDCAAQIVKNARIATRKMR